MTVIVITNNMVTRNKRGQPASLPTPPALTKLLMVMRERRMQVVCSELGARTS